MGVFPAANHCLKKALIAGYFVVKETSICLPLSTCWLTVVSTDHGLLKFCLLTIGLFRSKQQWKNRGQLRCACSTTLVWPTTRTSREATRDSCTLKTASRTT